jgi:hypothetical protein
VPPTLVAPPLLPPPLELVAVLPPEAGWGAVEAPVDVEPPDAVAPAEELVMALAPAVWAPAPPPGPVDVPGLSFVQAAAPTMIKAETAMNRRLLDFIIFSLLVGLDISSSPCRSNPSRRTVLCRTEGGQKLHQNSIVAGTRAVHHFLQTATPGLSCFAITFDHCGGRAVSRRAEKNAA